MVQRQWQTNGRMYTCFTCVGCNSNQQIPCQQTYAPPQPAYSPPGAYQQQNTPCGNSQMANRPQGAWAQFQNPQTSNCNCPAANQMTCQKAAPSGCVENGFVYQPGQVAVRNIGNGQMLKCQCVAVRNEATWRCDNHNQRPAGARTPSETGFQSPNGKVKTCYDGTMPGVPFLPSETWQSKRENKDYQCACKQFNGKLRTECFIRNKSKERRPFCIDRKSENIKEVGEKWIANKKDCICLLDSNGETRVDCKMKKNAGCIIKGKIVRFEDTVNIDKNKQCRCEERGEINCYSLCSKESFNYRPGEISVNTADDGSVLSCTCRPDSKWNCDLSNPETGVENFNFTVPSIDHLDKPPVQVKKSKFSNLINSIEDNNDYSSTKNFSQTDPPNKKKKKAINFNSNNKTDHSNYTNDTRIRVLRRGRVRL